MLEAAAEDGLPSKLCAACTDHMRIAYDFRSQAVYSERYFRNIIFLPVMKKSIGSESVFSPEAEEPTTDGNVDGTDDVLGDESEVFMKPWFVKERDREHENNENVSGMKCEKEIPVNDVAGAINRWSPIPENTLSAISTDLKCEKKIFDENTSKSELSEAIKGEQPQIHESAEKTQSESEGRLKHLRKKIECNLCGIGFTHINSLKQHLNKHSGAKPFQCEYCEKSFARRTILNIHRRLHTGERPYHCDECIRTFITKDAMHRHKEREHSEGTELSKTIKYTCSICSEERCSKNSLTVHMRTVHESKIERVMKSEIGDDQDEKKIEHDAPILTKSKTYSKRLHQEQTQKSTGFAKKLLNRKALDITWKCKACPRSFDKKYELLDHLQSHKNGELLIKRCQRQLLPKIQQSYEDKYLPTTRKRRKVETLHLNGSGPAEQSEANKSRYQQTTDNLTQWACPICRQEFSGLNVFKEHLRQHITARSFVCERCGLKFEQRSSLTVHSRLHSGYQTTQCNVDSKPSIQPQRYQCAVCNACFAIKYKLHYHLELHKIQNARCRKCEEKFVSNEELMKHIKRLHFDKRNHDYQCPDCSESLYDMRDLKEHLNERHCANIVDLEACDLCGVSFKSTREYYSHMHERHDSISKYCNECGEYFDSRKGFDKHIFSHFF